jgi:hypothetical protein
MLQSYKPMEHCMVKSADLPDRQQRWVFVPNKGTHDYTNAWNFGQLIFCTTGHVNRKDFQTMYNDLRLAMEDAQPDDYIMISSLSSLVALACAIFGNKFGCLNLLVYEDGQYIERHVTLDA